MKPKEALEKFGLSEKEANIYLASLELSEATAGDIALKSNIARTLTYDILERLSEKGLVSYSIKDHKKYFVAAAPEELSRILTEKQKAITTVMPILEGLYKTKGEKRPQIEIYEGKEGMKTLMDTVLRKTRKEFFAYGSSRSSYEVIPAFMEEWHKKRIKEKIIMKIIYNNTPSTKRKIKEKKESLKYTKLKLMPINLESPTATIIFEDYVALQSWTKEPFAILIHSKEMADNQKEYFKELWKMTKVL